MDIYEKRLREHGIRPTALRLLLLRTMEQFHYAFSMTDLEDALETVDKSTIFRTLTLFVAQHVVHEVEDESGSEKYCVVRAAECEPNHLHCHFYCDSCHKTFCFDDISIPVVPYPDGYQLREINYMMKGLCPDCARKAGKY